MDSQAPEIQALLLLVRAGMYDDAAILSRFPQLSGKQWEMVYAHAKKQTVSGVMCHALGFLPDSQLPPYSLLLRWVARTHRIESAYNLMSQNLAALIREFRANGLDPMLQKGHGVARFYPNAALRVCGDIDFCFTEDQRKAADALIMSHGVELHRAPDSSSGYRWNGTDVEHHTEPIQLYSPFHRKTLRDILQRHRNMEVEVAPGVSATVPAPLVDLLMINVHIMKHVLGVGIGLRQFCDYAMAYASLMPHIGAGTYEDACRNLGIVRWTDTLHRFVNTCLASPHGELPYIGCFNSTAAQKSLLGMVIEGGNFGLYRQGASRRRFRKFGTFSAFVRHSTLWMRIAPAEAMSIMLRLAKGQMI